MSSATLETPVPHAAVVRVVAGATIVIGPDTGELRLNGKPIGLTRGQKLLLAHLASRPGRMARRGELGAVLAKPGCSHVRDDCVVTCVMRLRRVLNEEAPGAGDIIQTVEWGYRLIA